MSAADDRKAAVLPHLDVAGLIRELFDRQTPAGRDQVLVLCAVHQESTPSCSVNMVSGLWNCKSCGAAGNIFDLLMAARGLSFADALAELEARCGIAAPLPRNGSTARPAAKPKAKTAAKPKPKTKTPSKRGQVVAVFRYFDAAGQCQYLKRRIEPGRDGRKKEFSFAHFAPDGSEAPGRGPCEPLLYGLHRLATAPAGERVFVAEGEAKVDALAAWGLIAVCTDSGAAGRWPETFNHFFTGREVVILPDHDAPGEKYAARVAETLAPVAAAVKVLRLPGLPEKGDLLDWIALHQEGRADA
jgi:putative DNA primase/helicase